jgi:hypothetical protein
MFNGIVLPARPGRAAAVGSEEGFIVFGMLLLVVGMIVTGVLVGKVIHADRYRYEVPLGERELRAAVAEVPIRYGAIVTGRVGPTEPVWVRSVGEGRLAVFEGERSARVIGFVAESDLAPRTVQAP